ncbi:hypothetical protein D3C81_856890 [compost metagenome]
MPTLPFAHHKSSFSQVMFGGDLLHLLVGKPTIETVDHCRIAGEGAVAECIDLMELQVHGVISDR